MLGFLPIVPFLTSLSITMPSPSLEREAARIAADIEVVTSPRVAQVRLAETLAEADAIESITARDRNTIMFLVIREGDTFEVIAKTTMGVTKKSKSSSKATSKSKVKRTPHVQAGEISSLTISRLPNPLAAQLHGLTWLGAELADVTAVTHLEADDDGAVMLTTNDGRRYMAIPGRGSGGPNMAAEARWAAEWTNPES